MAAMEDVLEVYQRPYDSLCPVVCIDETNKQQIKETRIPCKPGEPEKIDSVYERNGVADARSEETVSGIRKLCKTGVYPRAYVRWSWYPGWQ